MSSRPARQVGDQVEHEEPVFAGNLRVHFARDDAGRNVIHDDQAVDDIRVVLGEAGRDPRAAIVPDQCDAPNAERLQELDDVVGHCPLVIAL